MKYVIKNIPTKNEVNKILDYFENLNKNNIDFSKIEIDILKIIIFIIFEFEKNKEYIKENYISRAIPLILNSFNELKKYNNPLFDLCVEIVNLYDEASVYNSEDLKNLFFGYLYNNKNAKDFFLGK